MFIVLKTKGYAENIKAILQQSPSALKPEDILQTDIYATYYYANEIGIFNMRQSKFKSEHNIREHLVVLSLDDITTNLLVRMQIGWTLDFDVIMINQIVLTFNKHGGYVYRNDTNEMWYWGAGDYSIYRPNLKYDYQDNVSSWIFYMISRKIGLVLLAIIGYAYLSVINGLLIRVAIHCSNVIIFPLLSCMRGLLRTQLSRFQIAAIYRASPHIGAQAAYLDQNRRTKWGLISSYIMCLFAFYFMYGACYFLWSQLIFPQMIAKGINDLYFFYQNLLEFINLFFIRTRSSIKYFPKLILISNICFVLYINSYFYSAQYEFFSFLCHLSLLLLLGFLKYYEWEAINRWNPYGTYTPSINNPRTGYHLVFESQFMMGFDIWTMFHPLKFRESFSEEETRRYDLISSQDILGYSFDPQPRDQPNLRNRQRNNNNQQQAANNGNVPDQIQMALIQRIRDVDAQQLNQPMGDEQVQINIENEENQENNQDLESNNQLLNLNDRNSISSLTQSPHAQLNNDQNQLLENNQRTNNRDQSNK
eukprot:403333726